MKEYILTNEASIRAASFFGIFIVVALWEVVGPRRKLSVSKGLRWINNLGIVFFNTLLLRFLAPLMAVGLAIMAEEENWGLLNNIAINSYVKLFLAVLILDLIIYLQHVMFHTVPWLWRLHRMHHTDLDFDVTTGSRFHPIEIILSMIIKMLIVAALGAPPVAVIIFEVILNATAMFNHGNIRIHINADRILRLLVVTPDMHRVHHSVKPDETNSNYGFNFPWWDRLLGTYKAQPEDNHLKMTIGLNQFRESRYLRFHWLLIQPFVGRVGEYPIRKR
ncbi:MAG TPA: sterol desaturase family protein [Candidatus Scalindua sp.]|jgi:sterol desaturase/sphingolipid hydroxylase (fatty acid hydroxylase superfamily)|nr:sterol desaturase family protein [Candidatus Scalindua sp.]